METDDVQDIADMAVERDTLRWEVTRLRAELERAAARITELETQNASLEYLDGEAQIGADEITAERDRLRARVAELEAERDTHQSAYFNRSNEYAKLSVEYRELERQLSAAAPLRDGWRLLSSYETIISGDEYVGAFDHLDQTWLPVTHQSIGKCPIEFEYLDFRRRVAIRPDPLRDAAQRVLTNLKISGFDESELSDSLMRALSDLSDALAHPAPEAGESEGEK